MTSRLGTGKSVIFLQRSGDAQEAIGAFSNADFPKRRSSSTYVLTQIEWGRNIAPSDMCSKPKFGNVEGKEWSYYRPLFRFSFFEAQPLYCQNQVLVKEF